MKVFFLSKEDNKIKNATFFYILNGEKEAIEIDFMAFLTQCFDVYH